MSLPFLTQPVQLHSSRDPGECTMTPEQCAYKTRYWVFWYEADHRYALPTIAFFLAYISLFALFNALGSFAPRSWTSSLWWNRVASVIRYASYKRWRLGSWSTQSLGTYLLGAVGFIFFTSMTLAAKPYYWPNTREIHYGNSPPIATRAGWMALACLPFVLILATKANPIASLIGTSHENLIVWHNWVAWAMFVLALIHTFPFIVYNIWSGEIVTQWNTGGLWVTGVVALLAQAWLTFFSIRPLRERYYEIFKATHFFAGIVFVIFFFLHCDHILTSWDFFIGAAVLYSLSWLYSQCRTYFQYGLKHRAHLVLESGDTIKITIDTDATWNPGQHVYLRFLTQGIHALTAHPFTICSLDHRDGSARNQMVFYARAHGGLTRRLASLATKDSGMSVLVLMDGPYGGVGRRWFDGFDHSVVIGGGAGAGFTLALAKYFLSQKQINIAQKRKMTVLVSSRDPDLHHWYLEGLAETVSRDNKAGVHELQDSGLSIMMHATDSLEPRNQDDILHDNTDEKSRPKEALPHSRAGLEGVQITLSKGRADLFALCRESIAMEGASVGLVVCGPGSMVHDVGVVAASAQGDIMKGSPGASEVWFHKETFS